MTERAKCIEMHKQYTKKPQKTATLINNGKSQIVYTKGHMTG
jgi:hypothetical protein